MTEQTDLIASERVQIAIDLLKSVKCPEPIMDALWLFQMTVRGDEIKLANWSAWTEGQMAEGIARDVDTEVKQIEAKPS